MNHAMDCRSDARPVPYGPMHVKINADDFNRRIVNIANIEAGDTVMCVGDVDERLETAISARNAHLVSDTASRPAGPFRFGPLKKGAGVDSVFWNTDGLARDHAIETLAHLKHKLRPGGRLVLWFLADESCGRLVEPVRQLLASAGFTSVIAGRLAWHGQDAVVATGVLGRVAKR